MKVRKTAKAVKSKPKQDITQNETKTEQKKKLGNIFSLNKSVIKLLSSGRHTKSIEDETVSLRVNMDTSADTSVPSLIETIGCLEGNNNVKGYYVQQLSELVSTVNLKKKNSEIGRLPCKYKLKKKQRLIEKVPPNITPALEDNLQKCTAIGGLEFHVLNDSKVMLIMTEPMLLYFNGSVKVQVLMGSVEVLGYPINSRSGVQTVYSTRGTSHLCLKAITLPQSLRSKNYFATEKSMVEQFLGLRMKDVDKMNITSKLNETRVVIVLHKNKDLIYSEIWPKFLFKHCSSYSIFPQKNNFLNNKNRIFSVVENILNCLFELSSSNVTPKKFKELAEWSKIEDEIILGTSQLTPRTVLIGGKSVGKSTFLRYMVNKSLTKWEKVLVLDFDLGQSEFTLPGCVSAVLVEQPLLGTNFTHLMDPIRSVFLGDIDVIQCLETYMEGFLQVLNFCKEQPTLHTIPWFVNTMGFCKALGFSITASIIQQVSPTHVVQIQSHDKSKNFEKQLKPPVVSHHRFGRYSRPFARLNYTLLYIPSAAEEKEGKSICSGEWGMHSKQARKLVLCSYLSKMLTSSSLNLLELSPYVVSISKLYFEVHQTTVTRKQALFTMNGNLVALCCKSQNTEELPNCLGFGIVRGVDYDNDHLFLITPLKLSKLQDVNCLVKGNISLPESFLLESEGQIEGHVPFVAYTSKTHTTQHAKREFKPMKENAGTHIKNY